MAKMIIINCCRDCEDFVWGNDDSGKCCLLNEEYTIYSSKAIDPNCPLPDAPGAEDGKEELD